MAAAEKVTITVSTKGQVVLPKEIRAAKNWGAGQKLVVEETPEGVLLRAQRPFPPTKMEDVFGSLAHHGKRLTDEEIESGLRAAAKRHYDRN